MKSLSRTGIRLCCVNGCHETDLRFWSEQGQMVSGTGRIKVGRGKRKNFFYGAVFHQSQSTFFQKQSAHAPASITAHSAPPGRHSRAKRVTAALAVRAVLFLRCDRGPTCFFFFFSHCCALSVIKRSGLSSEPAAIASGSRLDICRIRVLPAVGCKTAV